MGTKDASTSHTRNDAGTDAVFLGTSLGGSVENFSGSVFQEEGHGVVLRVHSPGLSVFKSTHFLNKVILYTGFDHCPKWKNNIPLIPFKLNA